MPLTDSTLEREPVRDTASQTPSHAATSGPRTSTHDVQPGEPPKRNGALRLILLVVVLAAIGGLVWWKLQGNKKEAAATEQRSSAAASRPIPVTVAPVLSRTMPIFLNALGTVTAYNTVTVRSRVDGQLLSVPVREGQSVAKGQVLATIDPRPYQAVVAQAEGQLAKDTAAAENARAEAGRYTALYQAGVVSKESQQAQVSSAGQSIGSLDADRAAIQAAKVNVAYARITSPIDGVVGLRQVDAGNIVHAADTGGLLVVTQLHPIAVIFTLPEDQLQQVLQLVRTGRTLAVEAFDRSETRHLASGTLLTVDNQIDPTTGTVKVKAVFPNKDNALFPNQFVNVRLILEQRQNAIIIPAAALQTGTNGSFVYIVRPGAPPQPANADDGAAAGGAGTTKKATNAGAHGDAAPAAKTPPFYVDIQPVVTDLTEGSQIILKSGLNAGDQVVIDGQEKLKRFSKVAPQQGRSDAGGPGTQPIGSGGTSEQNGTPQPAGVDQPKPSRPQVGEGHSGRRVGG